MTAAGGREDYVSGVSEEAMNQEESRPAEQCRVCEGTGRLVRTLERGEVSSDCGNCGGTGVLPARPAVEEGPRDWFDKARELRDALRRVEETTCDSDFCDHTLDRHVKYAVGDESYCQDCHIQGGVAQKPRHAFAARPLVQEDDAGVRDYSLNPSGHEINPSVAEAAGISGEYSGVADDPSAGVTNPPTSHGADSARASDASTSAPMTVEDAKDNILYLFEEAVAGRLLHIKGDTLPRMLDTLVRLVDDSRPADDPRDEDDDVEAALAKARALVISAAGEAERPGYAMVTVRMEDRPRVSREFVVKALEEARDCIDVYFQAAIERRRGVAVPQARCADCGTPVGFTDEDGRVYCAHHGPER